MSLEDAIRKRSERIAALRKSCAEIFERSKNITLEIGCGKGHYLSEYAATFKDEICVGIDLISERISDSRRRAKNKNADNFKLYALGMDGERVQELNTRVDGEILRASIDTSKIKIPAVFFELVCE